MTDIFDKYGDYDVRIFYPHPTGMTLSGKFTLNELADALEEKLYPRFKERYDRERRMKNLIPTNSQQLEEGCGD